MKIRHRIAYDKEKVSITFIKFLEEKNANFEKNNSNIGVAFLCEEDDWKEDLYRFLSLEKITSIIDVIYSKEELEKAQWFSVRSKFRFEYPQPEDAFEYKNNTYESAKYCLECGCGLEQKDNFRINKAPRWANRHFLMLNWIHDELFTNSLAKECIINERLTGFKFLDVVNHKKNILFDDIFQIYIENKLIAGLVDLNQSVKEVLECRSCGKIKYIYSGKGLTYRKEIFEDLDYDIVKTLETFGDGYTCARKILVSKKLYHVINNYKLDKDLVFEPINFET
jgi:hypothetical protein